MSQQPVVSVIVPNYNHARFLGRRIESILSQTFEDFELIILDDASTDDSLEIINRFSGDPRISVISNTQNSGSTFKQWNRGLREASGEYVWIAESDDYADPHLLETLVGRLQQNGSAGIAQCQSCIVDEHDAPQGVLEQEDGVLRTLAGDRWLHDFTGLGSEECRRYLLHHNTVANASAVVFRRSIAEQFGLADESYTIVGDWLFWIKMLLRSDIVYVAQPLNYFRRHSATVRSRRTIDGSSIEESYRVISFLASQLPIEESDLEPIRESFCQAWLWDTGKMTIGIRRQLAIYQAARRMDPVLIPRCARQLSARFARFFTRRLTCRSAKGD